MGTITRYRGDTAADRFTIQRDGAALNITGWTFALTVNSEKDPVGTSTQLFTVAGVITSATAGQVQFSPDATQADQTPGDYYYDVQGVDPNGAKVTVDKGRYRFKQDITKS